MSDEEETSRSSESRPRPRIRLHTSEGNIDHSTARRVRRRLADRDGQHSNDSGEESASAEVGNREVTRRTTALPIGDRELLRTGGGGSSSRRRPSVSRGEAGGNRANLEDAMVAVRARPRVTLRLPSIRTLSNGGPTAMAGPSRVILRAPRREAVMDPGNGEATHDAQEEMGPLAPGGLEGEAGGEAEGENRTAPHQLPPRRTGPTLVDEDSAVAAVRGRRGGHSVRLSVNEPEEGRRTGRPDGPNLSPPPPGTRCERQASQGVGDHHGESSPAAPLAPVDAGPSRRHRLAALFDSDSSDSDTDFVPARPRTYPAGRSMNDARRIGRMPALPLPSAVRRRLNDGAATASSSSSRAGSAVPLRSTARPAAGPVDRVPGLAQRGTVVDLTADSDEEEVVLLDHPGPGAPPRAHRRVAFTGAAAGHARGGLLATLDAHDDENAEADIRRRANAAGRARGDIAAEARAGRAQGRSARLQQDIQDVEAVLARRREAAREIIRNERRNLQRLASPPPAPGPRIGLGGAVLQRGHQQIRFRAVGDQRPGMPPDIERRLAGIRRADADRLAPPPLVPAPAPHGYPQRALAAGANAFAALAHQAAFNFGLFLGGGGAVDDPAILQEIRRLGHMRHGAAAAQPPPPDIPAILAEIDPPIPIQPLPGFTDNFDLDAVGPITIDDEGDVVKPKTKSGLVCFVCHARLRLSGSYRSEDDRVWALRCGHMLHQRCLVKLATPMSLKELDSVQPPLVVLPVLGSAEKKSRKKAKPKVQKEAPREYEWRCPAKGCGKSHRSVKMPGTEEWVQVAGFGAFQVFM